MSQLVCPLCGRFVSLRLFDPSSFDPDVYAVNVRGLGRGKGFAVEETFSVLGVPSITGPIADRCRSILNMIEGKKVLSSSEASVLRAETEGWKGEALKGRKDKEGLLAGLAEMESQANAWRNETLHLRRVREEQSAILAHMEDEERGLKKRVKELEAEVMWLKTEVDNDEDDEYDEEDETSAMEEMQKILDRINASANTDFDYLSDAVNFLLEGG